MLEIYKEQQPLLYNYIRKIKQEDRISHAYIIETNGINYGFDIALSLSKYFLCQRNEKCDDCSICLNIDNENYPDIKIIETDTKEIKKEQMLNLQKSLSTKPIYGKYSIYIIKDAELLNESASNTILKFLEEPNDDIIAILLTDNIYNLYDTIVSRCQILTLNNNKNEFDTNIFLKYYNNDNSYETFLKNQIEEILEFYKNLETNKNKIISYNNPYKYKEKINALLKTGLHLYMEVLNKNINRDIENFKEYEAIIDEISKKNKLSDIIKKIDVINQFIEKNNINVNKDLFLDNFIITFNGGMDND